MMKSFLLALQFLTIAPIRFKGVDEKEIARSMIYFPFVGLLIGLALAGINSLLIFLGLERLSIDIILVISLVCITLGMHLDGLSDTFDALSSRKDKDQMLRIMRDPHIGVMGALGVIGIILIKISLLYSLSGALKPFALILMCIISRWSMVFAIFLFPYARTEGKAKVFFEGINPAVFVFSTAITLVLAFFLGMIKAFALLFAAAAGAYIIARSVNKKLNGITGDTLGAINEITEVIVLLGAYILERIGTWII